MAPPHYSRTYHRFPLHFPVIFGGAPFVAEGILTNLSLMGCSVMSDRYLKLNTPSTENLSLSLKEWV